VVLLTRMWSAVLSAWRVYWPAILLGLAAAGLVAGSAAVNGTTSTAMVTAGAALAGAAFTKGVDLGKDRRAEAQQALANAAQARDRHLRDLDEMRRIAYMALLAGQSTRNPEIGATIVNAFAHHVLGLDPEEVARHVHELLTMAAPEPSSKEWLQGVIDPITREMGQEAPSG
jgi:hypothetical protein